ncbi:hypothetical protein WMF20_39515 [Sorangium sp. So ce834]|uniref:hypothetical protein n=1 Tax=Sorangium sp. So ce834 TaxID=3133321 RepID=UPI003F637256
MSSLLNITTLALAAALATDASPNNTVDFTTRQRVDTGSFVAAFANSAYSRTSVEFKVPFSSPPLVFCSEWNNPGNWIFCKTDSVTNKDAMVVATTLNFTATNYTTNIAWMAIGD